jgi:hypothetical protein
MAPARQIPQPLQTKVSSSDCLRAADAQLPCWYLSRSSHR